MFELKTTARSTETNNIARINEIETKIGAGRGEGCVGRPVRPVGTFGVRYFAADLTTAKRRVEGRIVLGGV